MLTVRAPASCGNLGAGFDALSMALDLCNQFSAEPAARLEIENVGEGARSLSTGPDNLAYRAVGTLARLRDGLVGAVNDHRCIVYPFSCQVMPAESSSSESTSEV